MRSFMSRRFDYGTSEGMLQLLHPHRQKQMVIPPLSAALLIICLLTPFAGWWPLLPAALLLAADSAVIRFMFIRRGVPIGLKSLVAGRLRTLGSLIYYISYHLVRYYALPLLIIALIVPGSWARVLPAAFLMIAAAVDYMIKKPQLTFAGFSIIYLLEQLAYGAGVFWGCLSRKCFGSYRVVISRQLEQSA